MKQKSGVEAGRTLQQSVRNEKEECAEPQKPS